MSEANPYEPPKELGRARAPSSIPLWVHLLNAHALLWLIGGWLYLLIHWLFGWKV